jgi:hypothetical protein
MPIPTSYTYATFRDYLEKEVLQNVAYNMAWKDDNTPAYVTVPIVGTKAAAARWLVLTAPLTHDVPVGTKIQTTTVDGTTGIPNFLTVTQAAYAGESQIFTDTDYGSVARTVNTSVKVNTGIAATTAQSVYDSITNEALTMLGYSTPESVPAADIKKFRLMGRIEAWRAVVFNTVTDIDFVQGDTGLNRSQVFDFSMQQLDFAESEYASLYPDPVPVVNKPRVRTYSGPNLWRF